MEWTTNFLIALGLTSLAGSVFSAAWFAARLLFERVGGIQELYRLLWAAVIAALVPVGFLVSWCAAQRGGVTLALPYDVSPKIGRVSAAVFRIWLAGALIQLLWHIRERRMTARFTARAAEAPERMQVVFRTLCRDLGLENRRPRLCRSYGVRTPLLTGLAHPSVVLPMETYSDRELQVILLHELTHFRQRDLVLKYLMACVRIVHWFQPLIWALQIAVLRWCEYSCDYRCCRYLEGEREYFEVILRMAQRERSGWNTVASRLLESESELVRRVRKMKKCGGNEARRSGRATALFLTLLLGGAATVWGASGELQQRYRNWYEQTAVDIEEPLGDLRLTEYTQSASDAFEAEITEEYGEVKGSSARGAKSFSWTVGAGVRKKTAGFHVSAGQTITVALVISPSSLSVRVGIMRPDGTKSYVNCSGSAAHTFSCPSSGTYRFYVQNNNSSSVEVNGSYLVE